MAIFWAILYAVSSSVFSEGLDGFEPGVTVLNLESEGVGYAVDEFNEELITDEITTAVEEAKAGIIAGDIEVHDYTSDDSCPALTF